MRVLRQAHHPSTLLRINALSAHQPIAGVNVVRLKGTLCDDFWCFIIYYVFGLLELYLSINMVVFVSFFVFVKIYNVYAWAL